MIKFKATIKGLEFTSTVYNQWDIEESEVVEWRTLTNSDKGKYVMFDDGSELYAKIIYVGSGTVQTECGTYFIDDIVHCFQPKYKKSNYAGVFSKDLSLQVLPLGRQEKSLVVRKMRGEKLMTTTPRVAEGVTNEIMVAMEGKVTVGQLTEEMIAMATNPRHSPQKLKAIENLLRVSTNVDVTKLETQTASKKKDLGAIESATYTVTEDDQDAAKNMLDKIKGVHNG